MMLPRASSRRNQSLTPRGRPRGPAAAPRTILAAGIAVAAIVVTGCASGGAATQLSSSKSPITVGIIADLTGSTKTIGEQFINGSEAAAKVFGPIDGRGV